MKVTLPDFHLANVLVVGDVMLDRYWHGFTSQISPEAPVPIVQISSIQERPGGAANVAVNIAALGCRSHLIGLTGVDNAAYVLKMLLNNMKVNHDLIAIPNYSTTIKLRVLSRNQQLIRLDFEKNLVDIDINYIISPIKVALPKVNVLILSDYAKGALNCVQQIIDLAQNASIPVIVDPKGSDFKRYFGATVLTPNLSEFEAVVGVCKDKETIISRGMEIISDNQFKALLITRSKKGVILLQPDKIPLILPAQAKEVYDVTGAGDTVISVFAAAQASGKSLEESCVLANVAAGLVVGKFGTSTVSYVELKRAILSYSKKNFGVMTEHQLKKAVKLARQRGEKLVMTNGVFDILHVGHISYLTRARKLGDRLIVAVNTDDSVKRLKGTGRPVNSLLSRMTMLASLKAVDWVVPFSEDTPHRIVANVLPDVLVKGGDYQPNQIAGSKEVWANGGDVLVLSLKEDFSTTKILGLIKNSCKTNHT